MLELVRRCHYNKYSQPPVIRDITVYFDIVNVFKPYINKEIKFYSIPHYFLIQRVFGNISAMRTRLFSTSTALLPERPDIAVIDKDVMLSFLINEVSLPTSFAMMDGLDAIKFHLLGESTNKKKSAAAAYRTVINSEGEIEKCDEICPDSNEAFGNVNKSQRLLNVTRMITDLDQIAGFKTVLQQECRMQDEADGKIPQRSYQLRESLIKKIRKVSSRDKGYIC